MSSSGLSVMCFVVKSRSEFPDLLPFESPKFFISQRRAKAALAGFGASCSEALASLPQFELFVFVAMVILASA